MNTRITDITNSDAAEKGKRELVARRLHYLMKRVFEAQKWWQLIEAGDRVLVAVSGGKDSIVLCHVLDFWRRNSIPRFELAALHAEVRNEPGNEIIRARLEKHLGELEIPVYYTEMDHSEFYAGAGETQNCFRCSWKRRKELFTFAIEKGYNKLALGHHLDDAAETILINLLFHGNLQAMEPSRVFFDDKVTLIRPLIMAEEKEVVRVSSKLDFEFLNCACPGMPDGQREAAKKYIRSFGRQGRMIKKNLWGASRKWILVEK